MNEYVKLIVVQLVTNDKSLAPNLKVKQLGTKEFKGIPRIGETIIIGDDIFQVKLIHHIEYMNGNSPYGIEIYVKRICDSSDLFNFVIEQSQ